MSNDNEETREKCPDSVCRVWRRGANWLLVEAGIEFPETFK